MKKISVLLKKHKESFNNLGYLGGMQVINLVFPFIIYPHLINTIGAEQYGKALYYQGICLLLAVFINYGFNLSSTRIIASNKDNVEVIRKIYFSTVLSKLLLFVPVFIIYILLGYFNVDDNDFLIYLLCAGPFISEIFIPIWLYQGSNKLKYSTYINLILKAMLLIAIVCFVKDESDLYHYVLLMFLFHFIISSANVIVPFRYFNIKYVRIYPQDLVESYRDGFSVFLTSVFVAIKDKINIVIVGHFFGGVEVVVYDFAMKVLNVTSIPKNVLITSFFPKVANSKDLDLAKNISVFVFGINVTMVVFSWIATYHLYNLLLPNVPSEYMYIVMSLVISILPVGVSTCISRFVLVPYYYDKLLAKTVILNCVLYFFAIGTYKIFVEEYTLSGFTTVLLFTYFIEFIIRLFVLNMVRKKL
ncbi:oligosaccharide flippase family protein [Aliivibrio fischeri]|uniref:oligosaccharide flippase family protein n=1 Tax=Aliivibrio fischeri TaxID=668 RepID=UPI001C009DA7|nr:oligosaccharide flippase family protein [Aliivibrio fischeri]